LLAADVQWHLQVVQLRCTTCRGVGAAAAAAAAYAQVDIDRDLVLFAVCLQAEQL